MELHKILVTRNIFRHAISHPVVTFFTIWISGAFVAIFTNEVGALGVNINATNIALKWADCLINVWGQLKIADYTYLKLKLLASLLSPAIIVIIFYIKNFERIKSLQFFKQDEKVYGDASWANQSDIEAAGLRSKTGMLISVDAGGYFVADGFQHALLFAPTGSGKGVGFVIPNLLFWSDSAVVHDIKLENHGLTSGWREKQGQKVFVLDPSNPDSVTHCYNPIYWVSTNKPGQMMTFKKFQIL